MRSLLALCLALALALGLALGLALVACSSSDSASKEAVPAPPKAGDKAAADKAAADKPAADKPAALAPKAPADLTAKMLGELATAARCSDPKSPFRPWCIAATGWQSATVPKHPSDAAVLVGITIELEEGKPVRDALTNRVTLSALALRTEGKQTFGKITMITAENDEERLMSAEAVMGVSAVLKGMAQSAKIPANLAGYLGTLTAVADYPITKGAPSWTWAGASTAELRISGGHWIAIEKPSQGASGVFLSIFTDKIAK